MDELFVNFGAKSIFFSVSGEFCLMIKNCLTVSHYLRLSRMKALVNRK